MAEKAGSCPLLTLVLLNEETQIPQVAPPFSVFIFFIFIFSPFLFLKRL